MLSNMKQSNIVPLEYNPQIIKMSINTSRYKIKVEQKMLIEKNFFFSVTFQCNTVVTNCIARPLPGNF